jgi:hypothetical protein
MAIGNSDGNGDAIVVTVILLVHGFAGLWGCHLSFFQSMV